MSEEAKSEPSEVLTRKKIGTAGGIQSLGLLAASTLQRDGACLFYLDSNDEVCVATLRDLRLDKMTETEALQFLLSQGHSDEDLEDYLLGRDARAKI